MVHQRRACLVLRNKPLRQINLNLFRLFIPLDNVKYFPFYLHFISSLEYQVQGQCKQQVTTNHSQLYNGKTDHLGITIMLIQIMLNNLILLVIVRYKINTVNYTVLYSWGSQPTRLCRTSYFRKNKFAYTIMLIKLFRLVSGTETAPKRTVYCHIINQMGLFNPQHTKHSHASICKLH